MKTIRIFIGSSIVELEEERYKLMSFIQSLNNKYHTRDVFIEGYICEETSMAMRLGGSQAQHNDYVKSQADVTVFMFYHKAGEYTMEELRLAREAFVKAGKPNVYIFFKAVGNQPALDEDIKKCIRVVFEEYGHYYKVFENVDTIKLELLQYLSDVLPGKPELIVEDGKVYLAKEEVAGLAADNVFAYRNNPELKRLKEEMDEAKERMIEASVKGDFDQVLAQSGKYNELRKTHHALEKDILDTLVYFSQKNREGERANPRRQQALHLLELGKVDEAKALITQEELCNRVQLKDARKRMAKEMLSAVAEEEADILEDTKVYIRVLRLDLANPNRFDEIEACYRTAYQTAVDAKDYDLLLAYVAFLAEQKKITLAIGVGEAVLGLYETDENAAQYDKAKLLSVLLGLNVLEQTYDKAFDCASKAWKLLRADNEADLYLRAVILNDCSQAYLGTNDKIHSMMCLEEANTILSRLAEKDPVQYEPVLAVNYLNLGRNNHIMNHFWNSRSIKSDYRQALAIFERLARQDAAKYAPMEGITYVNLAQLCDSPQEEESYYLKALDILEKAYRDNPSAYRDMLATVYCNLGILYDNVLEGEITKAKNAYKYQRNQDRPSDEPEYTLPERLDMLRKAKKYLSDALDMFTLVVQTAPGVQNMQENVCNALYDLCALYNPSDDWNDVGDEMADLSEEQAESLLTDKIEVLNKLAKLKPAEYLDDLADAHREAGDYFYIQTERKNKAEKFYREALAWYRTLLEVQKKQSSDNEERKAENILTYEEKIAEIYTALGDIFIQNDQADKAKGCLMNAAQIYQKKMKSKREDVYNLLDVFDLLIKAYDALGDRVHADELRKTIAEMRKYLN